MDGNSLGRLPIATERRLAQLIREEWGGELIRGWDHWLTLPTEVGDRLGAALLGAAPGQVVVSDSTTVNLYKCAVAALDARPDRRVIVTDKENFPTDRYVFEGLAAQRGLLLRMVESDPVDGLTAAAAADAIDDDVALVSFSHVAYASGAIADMGPITEAAHRAGALALWDLSHTRRVVSPPSSTPTIVDLAVGCTYKYVNGGPGAPAFLYVSRARQPELRQPIWGWFGQRDQFEMGPAYDPVPGIDAVPRRHPTGARARRRGRRREAPRGGRHPRLRAKGLALTSYLIDLYDDVARAARLPASAHHATPRRRGSHVSLRHPDARALCPALISARRDPGLPHARSRPLRPRADHDVLCGRVGCDGLPTHARRPVAAQ